SVTLMLADATGQPVLSVRSLSFRPISTEELAAAGTGRDSAFTVAWQPAVPAGAGSGEPGAAQPGSGELPLVPWSRLSADGPMPDVVVFECPPAGGAVPLAVRS